MVEIKEQYIPEKFHHVGPNQVKTDQHNHTSWETQASKVPILDSISMAGKIGGIDLLFRRLVDFSCDANVQLRIVNGTYTLSGRINVFRGNMLGIIEHLVHEIDLLAHAIAHSFNYPFEVKFVCEQTIEFSMAA